ncbi:MAG: 3-dehydroquinate synthase [Acidimicrobiia bacterium]
MAVTSPELVIARGSLAGEILPERIGRDRAVVLTQPGAADFAALVVDGIASTGLAVDLVVVPDGEAAKTIEAAGELYTRLNRLGLARGDTVVAVGGGAVTDVGGFVAATYLRGIEAVYCPTTLLGAVDAAIGGKTGVNVGGKNLVGVFSQPARIVVDIDVLDQLPIHLRRQGMAEALKTGLVGDPDLVDLLERDGLDADTGEVVERAVAVKTDVVAEDYRESGRRAILNYGHTIGHAVEVVTGVSHGEAVAIGMMAAGAVSADQTGFTGQNRQRTIIERLGLPTSAVFDRGPARQLVDLDKKRDTSGLRMVLLEAVGRPVVQPVDDEMIDLALSAISG